MRFLLLGDICPTSHTAPLYREKNIEALFSDTVSLFRDRDFVIANLECALTDHGESIQKFGPPLKAPKETAEVLRAVGVDLCALSNNHVFDFGVKGVSDTIEALKENGIAYTGFGENYEDARKNFTVLQNGERVAVIAVCEHEYSYALDDRMGSRPYDEYDTMEDIRAAKETHDRVIVLYHGGKEHCRYPSPRLMRLCHAMAKNGADVVLCQHSHCIGAYEQFAGCHILYGQGNFHFVYARDGSHENPCWFTALTVGYDSKTHEISFVPIRTTESGIALAKGEEAEAILAEFEERNKTLQNGEWRIHWHEFCEEMRETYTKVVSEAALPWSTDRQNAKFAHYLDCEAHSDVFRELYPTYNQTNERG